MMKEPQSAMMNSYNYPKGSELLSAAQAQRSAEACPTARKSNTPYLTPSAYHNLRNRAARTLRRTLEGLRSPWQMRRLCM